MIVLDPSLRVKMLDSIADKFISVTSHVNEPHTLRLFILDTSESVHTKSLEASMRLNIKAGLANLVVLIDRVSVRHGSLSKMLKVYELEIEVNSV